MPALTNEARTLYWILEYRRRNFYLWVDFSHPLASLAHKRIYLMNAIVVKVVAHVGWTAGNCAPIQEVVGHFTSIALLPIDGDHGWIAPPVGLYALLNMLNFETLS